MLGSNLESKNYALQIGGWKVKFSNLEVGLGLIRSQRFSPEDLLHKEWCSLPEKSAQKVSTIVSSRPQKGSICRGL